MTSAEIIPVTATEARELTDRIKVAVDGTWQLIKQAYESRAWAALGYRTWDEYCTREFGTSRLRLPREERQEVVASMREIGMSTRAIARGIGVHQETVVNDLKQVNGNRSPEPRYEGGHDPDDAFRENRIDPDELDENDDDPESAPAPRPVIGTDGKRYPPPAPKPPQKPRTDVVATVNRALQRAQEAARAADDITRQHLVGRKDEAAGWRRSLVESLKSLQRLHDLLEENQ